MPNSVEIRRKHIAAQPPATSLVDAALRYAGDGWPVFPLVPRGKRPLTANGFKAATDDEEQIKNWWQRWPEANIGLPVPPGFIVVDIDSEDALFALKAEDLTLPTTVSSSTGRGRHLWYRTDVPAKNRQLLEGIDIKTDGGYIVAPPSVHPSGATYTWTTALDRAAITEAPDWLCEKLSAHHKSVVTTTQTGESWWDILRQPVTEGRRNCTLARVCGHLFSESSKLPPESAAAVSILWATTRCRPPLPGSEIQRTIESIAARELQSRRDSS